TAENIISSKRQELISSTPEDYLKIIFPTLQNNKELDTILVPTYTDERRLPYLQSFLDYIFRKMRNKDPQKILNYYSYGKKLDWYLTEEQNDDKDFLKTRNKFKIFCREIIFNDDKDKKEFYYRPYYLSGKLEKIK